MAFRVMDEANRRLGCKNPQCQKGCPINTPIPEVIRLLKEQKLDEAGGLLFENNPLTTVCNHDNQCEGYCVLGKRGTPVRFSVIEIYISTTYATKMVQGLHPSNGMKVAIVGSGPAGITIAILMARYGYQVAIFESKEHIVGMLLYGIPDFRLPKSVLDDIQYRQWCLEANEWGLLVADDCGRTSRPGIFASGDVVKGSRTVVEAVAYSKRVAEAMHAYIQNQLEEK